MDRELLLGVLVLLLAGPALWISGVFARRAPLVGSGRESEALRWRALWIPAVVPLVLVVTLLGWALSEPVDAEPIAPLRALAVVPVAFVWLRAFARAVWSVRQARRPRPAATVGLVRPRVFLDPAFLALLDEEARSAALAHERAHVRHHDPLRILVAQIVTDLQWPVPIAARRFRDWTDALELARDEEARLEGASGPALADAIVTCLKRGRHAPAALATLDGREEALTVRIRRLLDPTISAHVARRRPAVWRLAFLGLVFPLMAGLFTGEVVVRVVLLVLS